MGYLLNKIAIYSIVAFFIVTWFQFGDWQVAAVFTAIIGTPAYMVFRGLGLAH